MCYNENIRQKVQIIETEVNELGILDDINQIIDYISANENFFRIIAAVLIILITLAFRKLFARFISAVVIKLTEKTKTKLDDYIVGVANRPLSFAFIVVGVWLAVLVLKLPPRFDEFMGRVVSSLLAFAVFWAAYRASGVIASCIERFVKRTDSKIDDMILPLLKNSVKVIVVVIGITVIVDQWGYNIAGLLAGLGLGGLAFALAAQDTAANLFGGITVMLDKPFSIGDWIFTPQVEGIVEQMGIRSTRIRTFAQALVTVPNSALINNPITNWSRMGKRRITYKLRLTYDSPQDKLRQCIEKIREMLKNHPGIHPDTIFVYLENFGENAFEVFLYFFTNTIVWKEYLEVQEDVNMKVLGIIEELGLSIAVPSRSIHLRESIKDNEYR